MHDHSWTASFCFELSLEYVQATLTADKTEAEIDRGNIYNVKWNRVRDDSLIARLNGTYFLHPRSITLGPLSPVLYSLRSDLFIFQFKVESAAHPGACHESTYRCLRVQSPLRQDSRAVLHETSRTPIHSANQKWPLAHGPPNHSRAPPQSMQSSPH